MDEQPDLFPTPHGLTHGQAERLSELADTATGESVAQLLRQVEQHVDEARFAHGRNRLINVRFAQAISDTLRTITDLWDQLSADARYWFRGAMRYFVSCEDDEPDFTSAIGFEDYAEVLNACLRLAGRDDLCLSPEDYDDA